MLCTEYTGYCQLRDTVIGHDESSCSQASNGRCPGLCWLFFALWFGAVVISTPEPNTAHESFYRAGDQLEAQSRLAGAVRALTGKTNALGDSTHSQTLGLFRSGQKKK